MHIRQWLPSVTLVILGATHMMTAQQVPAVSQAQPVQPPPVFHQDVSWSPDGRHLAFSASHNNDWHIYLADVGTGTVQSLTSGPAADQWAAWGPDSRRVAYASAPKGQPSDIYVVDTGGTAPAVRLTVQDGQRSSQVAWSRDGRSLAFVSKRGSPHQQLWVMASDGSHQHAITSIEADAECPQWSPDGRQLVFYGDTGNHQDQVWTVDLDGTHLTPVTHDTANNIYPSWTPSGEVVWSRQIGDTSTVMSAKPDGSSATPLVPQPAFFARVSPDGQSIALIVGHFPSTTVTVCDNRGEHCRAIDPKPAG